MLIVFVTNIKRPKIFITGSKSCSDIWLVPDMTPVVGWLIEPSHLLPQISEATIYHN